MQLACQNLHQLHCPFLYTSNTWMSFSSWEAQKWTETEVSPEQYWIQGHNTALVLLATLLPIQAGVPSVILATWTLSWVMFRPRSLRSFSTGPLSNQSAFSTAWACCVPSAGPRTWPWWTLCLWPWPHWTILTRSLCRPLLSSSSSTFPPIIVFSAELLKVHLIPSFRSSIKILNNNFPPNWGLGTLVVASHYLDLTPYTSTH